MHIWGMISVQPTDLNIEEKEALRISETHYVPIISADRGRHTKAVLQNNAMARK